MEVYSYMNMITLPAELKFSCSALTNYNGHDLKAAKPDENGCYEVVLGCVGDPTRANVIYEASSLISAMKDPNSRFNICLKDGILFGVWGHPDICSPDGKQDMRRLLKIDESKMSHLFTKIWIDDKAISMHGCNAFPIRAKVKPCGPYGAYLEKSLQDPNINTAFSIRSLCEPTTGSEAKYEYRKVDLIVTFDAVGAPGYEIATKRYISGQESMDEIRVTRQQLEDAISGCCSMESLMITDKDVARLYNERSIRCSGTTITGVGGAQCVYGKDGNLIPSASLIYRR